MYHEDDMLILSGIQHYRFCPRQWALIHIYQQWEDNRLTIEGQILHTHVDDPFYRQKCGDFICLRSVHIASRQLGLYGIADVVELQPTDDPSNCISHPDYSGNWLPVPVEYKRGKPKRNEIDEVQLMAQAMCLEEMYDIQLTKGFFYYAEIRHRVEVVFSDQLRKIVRKVADSMHELFKDGKIPEANHVKHCEQCSIKNLCLPEVSECMKVSNYLKTNLLL